LLFSADDFVYRTCFTFKASCYARYSPSDTAATLVPIPSPFMIFALSAPRAPRERPNKQSYCGICRSLLMRGILGRSVDPRRSRRCIVQRHFVIE